LIPASFTRRENTDSLRRARANSPDDFRDENFGGETLPLEKTLYVDMLKIFTKNQQNIIYFLDFSRNAREFVIICTKNI